MIYESKQLLPFRNILENIPEGVVITDKDGCIKWINGAFTEITGYSFDEILDENPRILKSGIHDEDFYENMWNQLLDEGRWSGEIWNKNKQGIIYSEWLNIRGIKDDFNQENYYVGIFKDLSQKKKIDRRMADLQQKDLLTGIYNRSYFLEKMDKYVDDYMKTKEEFTIIIMGIKDYNTINDSLGHLTGDKLLIELSKRLSILISDKCSLSRIGGDEFAILCKYSSKANTRYFIETVLDKINEPFKIENAVFHIDVNVGISRFPKDGDTVESLTRYARIAMHKAKKLGEERICFYTMEMSDEIEEEFYLANYLFGAISNNELSINYQPIFDIDKSTIIGAEALLRWEHSILGKVAPDKFISIAEKTGQILSIGNWVIREVCKQINKWKYKGCRSIPISINISAKQLEQSKFSKTIIGILRENKILPNNIELEITESVSFGDVNTIVKNLKELKNVGFKISMDDFGTGYSSMGQLSLFELDKLKIDKIFIDDLVKDSKNKNIVKSIIALANSLNLQVVAEGIESNEQLLELKKLGCSMGQGYLFSRPLLGEDMDPLLKYNKDNVIKSHDYQVENILKIKINY